MNSFDSNQAEIARILGVPPSAVASSIFASYAERLQKLAKKKIDLRLQGKVAPEDIVQSALKSFFRAAKLNRFQLNDAEGLWALLVVFTLRKCAKWDEHYAAHKRDVRREARLDSSTASQSVSFLLESQEPTPHDAYVLAELLEELLDHFEQRQQEMVRMRLQGFELEEIASQLKSSRRTVARVMAEAKLILRKLLELS